MPESAWHPVAVKKASAKTIHREKLPGAWRERLRLGNGRELVLRPIQPEDAGPIEGAFKLLNEEEVRLRYMHLLKELSPEYLHRLTHPPRGREFVLVAAEPLPPGEALVGAVARMAIDEDQRHGEFAILVSRYLAGHGLGRLMMRRLISHARRRRLSGIHGDVLEDNTAMLGLAESLGFQRRHQPGGGTTRVSLELVAPTGKETLRVVSHQAAEQR